MIIKRPGFIKSGSDRNVCASCFNYNKRYFLFEYCSNNIIVLATGVSDTKRGPYSQHSFFFVTYELGQ